MLSPSAKLPADQLTFVPLRDCGRWLSGGTPSTEEPSFWDGDIPWITASSLTTFHLEDSERKLTELGLQNGSRLVPRGTILFVVRGMSLKSEFRMGITMRPCSFGQDCKAILPSSGFDPLFLAYAIKAKTGDILELVDEAGHGTGRLQTDLLSQLPIPAPPLAEQQRIAEILGSLDDKIELNRRMNRTLEELARAVFKAWFVDFLPVKAKQDGAKSFPGTDADTFALFPDSFEDSPLGHVPKGWRVEPLSAIAEFLNGQPMQRYPANGPDSLPVIKIAELRRGITESTERANREVPSRYVVQDGDLLFSWSGTLEVKFWTLGEGALNQHLFKVTSEHCPTWFVYEWLLEHLSDFQAVAASKATTMGHIQRSHLDEALCVVPSVDVLGAAGRLIGPLIQLTIESSLESRTIAATRDILIYLLLSGWSACPAMETLA